MPPPYTEPGPLNKKQADQLWHKLVYLIQAIEQFDEQCKADEETDTGYAWDLFNAIRDEAKKGLALYPSHYEAETTEDD
jgi:hypothetical protein